MLRIKKNFFLNLRAGGFFHPYHMLIQFAKGFALVHFCTNSTATSRTTYLIDILNLRIAF